MRQRTYFAIFVCLGLFFSGCATVPTTYDQQKAEGQWDAKAQIRDLEKGKNNNVSLAVMAEKDHLLRMEVTGTLGVSVASFLLSGNEVSYAIHTQKRFFSGPASEKALAPLFNISVDPRWLYNIFFDEPIAQKNWGCQSGEDQLVEKCERLADGIKIQWTERKGEGKRIIVSNAKFELQILVKGFKPKVQSPEKAFSLNPPDSYKRYKLQ